jgi:SNF2 family DNA or RNA helicase
VYRDQNAVNDECDTDEMVCSTPRRKRRKRPVVERATGRDLRAADKKQREEENARRIQLEKKLSKMGMSTNGDPNRIIINDSKFEDQAFIYLNGKAGLRIKPHQIDGVKFMWRQVVCGGEKSRQGCLLAHTMGLGKTMQV